MPRKAQTSASSFQSNVQPRQSAGVIWGFHVFVPLLGLLDRFSALLALSYSEAGLLLVASLLTTTTWIRYRAATFPTGKEHSEPDHPVLMWHLSASQKYVTLSINDSYNILQQMWKFKKKRNKNATTHQAELNLPSPNSFVK